MQLRIVTQNIWGLNTPHHYWRRRGIHRGALPGSPALQVADPADVWRQRRSLLVTELARIDPDLVAFQESFCKSDTSSSQALEIARALGTSGNGYHTVDGLGGLAVLTRFPPLRVREHPLDVDSYGGHPGLLEVTISTSAGEVTVIVAHWPVGSQEAKVLCAAQTHQICRGLSTQRLVLCGDFNADSDSPPICRLLADGWLTDTWQPSSQVPNKPLTTPLPSPSMRLDYIFTAPCDTFILEEATIFGETPDSNGLFPSDHCGISSLLSFI